MMDAGGVVLVPVQTQTPTPTRRRRPRRRRARNSRGVGKDDGGIIDPLSLSLYNPKCMIAYDTNLLGTAVGVESERSPDEIYEAMLRNHLLNQKRVYGLRPTVGQDTSISSRLGGRIKVAVNNGCQAARESVWDRLSPEIPKRGSLRDRMKWPVEPEDLGNEGGNVVRRRPLVTRNLLDDTAFAGAKSPAGLKTGKSAGKDLLHSFEGPKPLSVILKRKRKAGGATASQTTDEEAQKNKRKRSLGSRISAVAGTTNAFRSLPTKEISSDYVQKNKVVSVAGPVNVVCPIPAEEIASNHAHDDDKVDCKSPEGVPGNALVDGVDMHLIKRMRNMSISASLGDLQRSYAQSQGGMSCIQQCSLFTTLWVRN